METDPRFAPLAAIFRTGVIRAIVSQLDRSNILPDDLDLQSAEFQDAIYTIAFLVLAQLEEGLGFEHDGARFHSHLVFTPRGETPAKATELIAQEGRTIVHGGLTDVEISAAILHYLNG